MLNSSTNPNSENKTIQTSSFIENQDLYNKINSYIQEEINQNESRKKEKINLNEISKRQFAYLILEGTILHNIESNEALVKKTIDFVNESCNTSNISLENKEYFEKVIKETVGYISYINDKSKTIDDNELEKTLTKIEALKGFNILECDMKSNKKIDLYVYIDEKEKRKTLIEDRNKNIKNETETFNKIRDRKILLDLQKKSIKFK